MTERTVVSNDGTEIGYEVSGSGPPLVMVHGTTNDRTSFRFVAPILAKRFQVLAMDRRGRGRSGDVPGGYSIEAEMQDVVALVDAQAEPVHLFGHSFGASVALGAAAMTGNLRRLVLYEATPGVANVDDPSELDRFDQMAASGDHEELIRSIMVDLVGMSEEDFAELRGSDVWERRVATAPTIAREFRVEEAWRPGPEVFEQVTAPVLLLLGTESPDFAREATEMLHDRLPDSRIAHLEGHGHVATLTAPELLAEHITGFLSEDVGEREHPRRGRG